MDVEKLPAMPEWNKTLCAYVAGVFDGEGSIILTNRHNGSLAIKVTNTDKRLCQVFYENWGGSIYEIESPNPKVKTIYRWGLYGRNAKYFLLAISPYSIHKAKLITKGLEYIELKNWSRDTTKAQHKRDIANAIYTLNA